MNEPEPDDVQSLFDEAADGHVQYGGLADEFRKLIARREKAARITGRREGVERCIRLLRQSAFAARGIDTETCRAGAFALDTAAAEIEMGLLDEKELAKGLEEKA